MADLKKQTELDPSTPPESLEVALQQANTLADGATGQINRNVELAANLGHKAGDHAGQTINEMSYLAQEVEETKAVFEARVKRLNSPYVMSPELAQVVEVAQILNKPLILEGEPGTGKTSLAYAIAGEKDLQLIHIRGKSTLNAQSILYEVDNLTRLRDAMLSQAIPESLKQDTQKWIEYLQEKGDASSSDFQNFMTGFERASKLLNLGRVSDVRNYIKYGEMGKAIKMAADGEKVLLLFDEIDKARREFPNDLLDELEHMTFYVRETGEEISAPRENITVLITSNHEKDLPEPVLRRCVYNYIEFPSPEQMTEIVNVHLPDVDGKLLDQAIETFYKIRGTSNLEKRPSTSEMLDWMNVLIKLGITEIPEGKDIPFLETLLKNKKDFETMKKGKENSRSAEDKNSLPSIITEVDDGKKIIAIKTGWEIRNEINVVLANNGIEFNTSSFDIMLNGVTKISDGIFSFDPKSEEAMKLFELMENEDFVELEFGKISGDIKFASIERSNGAYVNGKDSTGVELYRTKDGQFYSWYLHDQNEGQEAEVTPRDANVSIDNLGLDEKYAEELKSAGLSTVKDLILKIEAEDAGQSLFEIDGIKQGALVDIKREIREGGYKILNPAPNEDEDNGESLLGESTLAKLKVNRPSEE